MMLSRRTGPSLADIAAVEKELAAPGEPEWLKAEVIFLRRLGGLARLHTIDLRDGNTVDPLYAAFEMSWTLRAGLSQLSGLVHLEVLRLGHWRYLQDIAEFKWMKMRWPNLYRLSCFEIGNEQKRDWLKTYWPELDLIETAHGSEDPSCSNGKARR
ncbi:hypothetical protein DFQ26_004162 [Actinomortierella ambigua]|nr:hypothetical protein DFQ26_004162 [Actinomortierella ambigua]